MGTMILAHDYSGRVGRCRRCGLTRKEGADQPCELPEEREDVAEPEAVAEGRESLKEYDKIRASGLGTGYALDKLAAAVAGLITSHEYWRAQAQEKNQ